MKSVGLLGLTMLVTACADDPPDFIVKPGIIEFYQDPTHFVVPPSATVRTPFTVEVWTFGGGCESLERTDVEFVADGAIVTPYDRSHIPGENEACPQPLLTFQHEKSFSFDTPGSKTVRIHGRHHTLTVDEEMAVPFTIVVNE